MGVLIESTIISSSKPSVSWQKDDEEIDLKVNQHFVSTISETGEGSYCAKLEIKDAGVEETGVYTFVAKNEKGETISTGVNVSEDVIEEEEEKQEKKPKKKVKKEVKEKVVE